MTTGVNLLNKFLLAEYSLTYLKSSKNDLKAEFLDKSKKFFRKTWFFLS
jgi:hypothetical protein